jgi:anthranilate synthase component 2
MSGKRAIQTHRPDGSLFLFDYGSNFMKLLMIDNYDSFTHNLVQLFSEFDLQISVYRNDQVHLGEIAVLKPDWICISPGPKTPGEAGISRAVVETFGREIPTLGVCLGMQVINEAFGGATIRAPQPRHGKCSMVNHRGIGLFQGLPSPLRVARYHSLQVQVLSPEIIVLAHAEDGVIMALEHRKYPICGVQFHPESFLSEAGLELVENFLSVRTGFDARSNVVRNGPERFPRWNKNGQPGIPKLSAFSHAAYREAATW